MSNIDKQVLREAAEKASTDNHTQDEWFHYLRCSSPATVLALLDELEAADALNKHLELAIRKAEGCSEALRRKEEAAEKRIADQYGIIASARRFISEYAGLGDVGAAEFIKIIDRTAAGKGE